MVGIDFTHTQVAGPATVDTETQCEGKQDRGQAVKTDKQTT